MYVHSSLYGKRDLKKIARREKIGNDKNPRGFQIPLFENIPIIFCSYVCVGYPERYGKTFQGIVFETDSPIIYACPVDTHHLLRDGHWIPGWEKFIFSSIEEMLEKYPTSKDFKTDFQEYFRKLKPEEVYHGIGFSKKQTELRHHFDYCLDKNWNPGCNEITFRKPVKINAIKLLEMGEVFEGL